jgi:hypothetical protein
MTLSIFLAGGISDCPDWQDDTTRLLRQHFSEEKLTIYNPRKSTVKDHSCNEDERRFKQIQWEYDNLNTCDICVFYFLEKSPCPISLYELGRMNERKTLLGKPDLYIVVDENYDHRNDVIMQTQIANGSHVFADLETCIKYVVKIIESNT